MFINGCNSVAKLPVETGHAMQFCNDLTKLLHIMKRTDIIFSLSQLP
jgi:hypothetical protein